MSPLAKRILIVVVAGAAAVGVATIVGRRDDAARFEAAKARVNAECRAYRGAPRHHYSAVCRPSDPFEPRAVPRYAEAERLLETARANAARGDTRGAEASLRSALASVDELDRMGHLLGQLIATSIVKQSLDILSAHRELDARSVLHGVHLDVTRPFERTRLEREWILVNWDDYPGAQRSRSTSELADALERTDKAFRAMDERIVHADVAACTAASRDADLEEDIPADLCARMLTVVQTAARLDAARR